MPAAPSANASNANLSPRAVRLLETLATEGVAAVPPDSARQAQVAALAADLVEIGADSMVRINVAGRAHLARLRAAKEGVDPFLAQHIGDAAGIADGPEGRATVRLDQAESPLAWLARRKGRDGAPLIAPAQLQAGERLRAEFTRAQMSPRVTSNWTAAAGPSGRRGDKAAAVADTVIAARQRMRRALEAAGPEFAGLLLDVCCFLKRLDDVERERRWPARSAKVVLQLGLDRLARHYGLESEARGGDHAAVRTWLAEGAEFSVDAM